MSAQELSDEERHAASTWWLFPILGAISIAVGVIVLMKPGNSLTTLAVIMGIFVLVDGVFSVLGAITGRAERRGLAAIVGAVSVAVGVLLIRHPTRGVLAIALLVGIWLIAVGTIRLVEAFEGPQRVWRILVALIEIAAGIVIVSSPAIAFGTLALIVGISLILDGSITFAVGWMLHGMHDHEEAPTYTAHHAT
jgi:uncharacterized membrane protein HdeD (DUF308 family)